ncbi:MAG: hypothetical protein O3C57_03545 [Verrucomicrobia bacterium]|nr:hypothetical protein [Verrucomicrobiota bacterium]
MPCRTETLTHLFRELRLNFVSSSHGAGLALAHGTTSYLSPTNEPCLRIEVSLWDSGELICFRAPHCYAICQAGALADARLLCLRNNNDHKAVKFMLSEDGAYVEACVNLFLAGTIPGTDQVRRCLQLLVEVVDNCDEAFKQLLYGFSTAAPTTLSMISTTGVAHDMAVVDEAAHLLRKNDPNERAPEKLRTRIATLLSKKGRNFRPTPDGFMVTDESSAVSISVQEQGGHIFVQFAAPVASDIRSITPELTRFLAVKCNEVLLGRFSLSSEDESLWFEHALLGDSLNETEFEVSLGAFLFIADEIDNEICRVAEQTRRH